MAQVYDNAPQLHPTSAPSRLNMPVPIPTSSRAGDLRVLSSFKNGHHNLDTFSPVNQNGSFEFDRVLKSGKVLRRIKNKGAWKPSWKPAYLVLRPNLLSIYKAPDETGLYASITLTDVTAVAQVKKTKIEHVFGVFSPAKNHYFQGLSGQDAQEWIEKIRIESRADLLDEFTLPSPRFPQEAPDVKGYDTTSGDEDPDRPMSSYAHQPQNRSRASTVQRRTSHLNEYSGNEMMTSHSDFSDAPGSLPKSVAHSVPQLWTLSPIASGQNLNLRPNMPRNASQMSGFDVNNDPERVIRHGWLQCLQSKGGVKSWKNLWVVLRAKTLTFYKDEDEYSAVKIIPMSSVINAADIDAVSKSKKFCFQIIVEDKTYRMCAADEEELAKWLGALKSVLAKRVDASASLSEGLGTLKLAQKGVQIID